MIEYTRNIRTVLLLLQCFTCIGIAVAISFLFLGRPLIAGVATFSLLVFALVNITKVTLKLGSIEIIQHKFFGCAKNLMIIDCNSNLKGELVVNKDINNMDSDSIFDIVVFVIPFLYKKYSLSVKDNLGRTRLIIKLTHQEFSILQLAKRFDKSLPLT